MRSKFYRWAFSLFLVICAASYANDSLLPLAAASAFCLLSLVELIGGMLADEAP